jgi:DNA-binding IclR family transcriptional regulator
MNYLATVGKAVGVTELSKHLSISKSSAWRSLSCLERQQWVLKDPVTGMFTPGIGVLELGLTLWSKLSLRSISLPYLTELRDITGESTMCSIRVGLERIYVESIESLHLVRYVAPLGKRLPLWAGATGKVILAHLEEGERERVIDDLRKSGLHVYASGEAVDADRLVEELAKIRREGFAVSTGERVAAVTAVAAPIFDHNHRITGAMCVTGPLPRFTPEIAADYGPLVSQRATKISQQLGDRIQDVLVHR